MGEASSNGPRSAEVHTLLGNQRRLLVVGYLSLFAPRTSVEVRHIARVVRGIETDTPPRQVGTAKYESAYNGLIQAHLPRLDEAGLIEYDERCKEVLVTPRLKRYALLVAVTQFVTSV